MMKEHKTILRHALTLLLTLIAMAALAGEVFKPKFRNDNYWPLDVTYQSFYEMKKDSVDAIFLGSSHAISAFSPQELYDECGIRSFNLGSEEQSLVVSYYWLKEALRFQKPQAVVLDTVVCFPFMETPYNCNEASIRKALDPMKWSSVKTEAVRTIGALDPKETFASYLFPIIRYHARWNDLSLSDIRFFTKENTSLKGYAVLSEDTADTGFEPLTPKADAVPAGMQNVMRTYLEKTVQLCGENGIQMILVSTPYTEMTAEVHQAVSGFAEEHDVRYVDFNEASVIEAMNYDFPHDMADAGHANNFGAEKLTGYIGNILMESGIQGREDAQYENSRAYCERQLKNANLYRIQSFSEYYSAIDPEDYLIFMTWSGNEASALLGMVEAGPAALMMENGRTQIFREPHSEFRFGNLMHIALESDVMSGRIRVYDLTYERSTEGLQVVLLDKEKGYVIDHSVFDASGRRIQ